MQTFHTFYAWKERNWIEAELSLSRDLDGIIGSGQSLISVYCHVHAILIDWCINYSTVRKSEENPIMLSVLIITTKIL